MMRLFSNHFANLGHRVLGVLFALSVAWLSWGNAAMAAKASPVADFSESQIAQIQKARNQITAAQDRLGELGDYISAQDWTYTGNFIHGPLGDLRREAATINRNLPVKAQKEARKQANELMALVERIDAASKDKNRSQAAREFAKLEDSFASFLSLVPNFETEKQPQSTADSSLEQLVDGLQDGTETAAAQLEDTVETLQENIETAVEAN